MAIHTGKTIFITMGGHSTRSSGFAFVASDSLDYGVNAAFELDVSSLEKQTTKCSEHLHQMKDATPGTRSV